MGRMNVRFIARSLSVSIIWAPGKTPRWMDVEVRRQGEEEGSGDSWGAPRTWLKVLADPAASMVPTHTDAKGTHATGPPAAKYPADVVITTSALPAMGEKRI